MRMRYVSLEEAHPPFKRASDTAMGDKMLKALRDAADKGRLRVPVPDSARADLLASKKRHSFSGGSNAR